VVLELKQVLDAILTVSQRWVVKRMSAIIPAAPQRP